MGGAHRNTVYSHHPAVQGNVGQELSLSLVVLSPGEVWKLLQCKSDCVPDFGSLAEIFDRIEKGESVRDDGFFNNHGSMAIQMLTR